MKDERKVEPEVGSRDVVPSQCVRVSKETTRVSVPRHGAGDEPRIELIREGEFIKAIDVTCTCGQRIRLSCVY